MVQTQQNVRSTTSKTPKPLSSPAVSELVLRDKEPQHELYIRVDPLYKFYIDDTGCFTVQVYSGNQYIMIAYHCDSNTILVVPFKTQADKYRCLAYDSIIQRLKNKICSWICRS